MEFQRLLDEGVVKGRAELASRFSVSRARVTQVLNILRLSRPALSLVLESSRKDGFQYTERQLRPILQLPESAQLGALQLLQEQNRKG